MIIDSNRRRERTIGESICSNSTAAYYPCVALGTGFLSADVQFVYIALLGNLGVLDKAALHASFRLLWKQYGEIYLLEFPGRRVILISSQRLAVEVLDEKRFHKAVAGGLQELRNLVGDGLFTARLDEPNWAIARTCVPCLDGLDS